MIRLVRITTGEDGTFGVLLKDDVPLCVTLELPWRDNQRDVSCIPEGWYQFRQVDSPRFGDTFEVRDVPGRTNILFHAGNTVEDSSGCILLGLSYGFSHVKQKQGIRSSRMAMRSFMCQHPITAIGALQIVSAYSSSL